MAETFWVAETFWEADSLGSEYQGRRDDLVCGVILGGGDILGR